MPKILLPLLLICCGILSAQPWVQDGSVFNTSGVPSVSFSQPRFCDLDNDGDWDFWLVPHPAFTSKTAALLIPPISPDLIWRRESAIWVPNWPSASI